MKIDLYKHNADAYSAAVSLMNETGKAAIIHPTGTGKSYIAFKLAKQNHDEQIVWLSPSEYIFKTQLESLKRSNPDLELSNIKFMTYSKLALLTKDEVGLLNCAYIILDEFHRCGAEKWGEGVQRLLTAYPNAKILGLSATNVRYLDNRRDMADELFDGNIASEITLGEAIVRGILPAPKYVTSVYSYQKELAKYEARVKSISEKPLRDANQKYLDALRRALENADGLSDIFAKHIENRAGKYIVFCANLEHLKEMQNSAKDWFAKIDKSPKMYTAYCDDPTTSKEFADFQNDESDHLKLLFCIDMFNEGIHLPNIDGVILFRPTVSPIIYKQQIGRALCTGSGKTPLIFDIVNNFDNLYSISSLKEEMLTAANFWFGGEGISIVEHFKIYDEVRECREIFDALQTSLSAGWQQHYAAAKLYFERNGNLNVPNKYKTQDGLSLGSWLTTQRRVRSGQVPGNLDNDRIAMLDEIGMLWNNKLETAWERNFSAAEAYKKEFGNLDVPARYVAKDGTKLGGWITNLRQANLDGSNRGVLTQKRIDRLNSIGMIWNAVSVRWEQNYAEAAKYYSENGDLNVKANYKTASGFALGAWIRNLRRSRMSGGKGATLTQDQIMRLDSIGMTWQDCNDARWLQNYAAAKRFYEAYGHLNIPATYVSPEKLTLGKWIYKQRCAKNNPEAVNNKLNTERIKLLDEIGMIWKPENSWEIRYAKACEYLKQHGDVNIPQSYKTNDGIWLGKWLYEQKRICNKEKSGRMTAEQKQKISVLANSR